jgi:hypothetical protein
MADDVVVSAPSAEATPAVNENPETYTDAQRDAWMRTGEMPGSGEAAAQDEVEDSADDSAADDAADSAETAAASETAKGSQEPPKRKTVTERNAEIKAEIDSLHENLRKRAELRKQASETGEKKAESPTAKEEWKPLSEDEYFEKNPDKTFTDFINAAAAHQAKELLRQDKEATKQAETQAKQEATIKEGQERWKKQLAETAKEIPDAAEVVYGEEVQRRLENQGNISGVLRTSENAPKLLASLGKNLPEFDRILAIEDPYVQVREFIKYENTLSGKKQAPVTAKKVTSVTPIHEVGGRGSTGGDEVEEALKDDDFEAFRKAENRRDLERARKG